MRQDTFRALMLAVLYSITLITVLGILHVRYGDADSTQLLIACLRLMLCVTCMASLALVLSPVEPFDRDDCIGCWYLTLAGGRLTCVSPLPCARMGEPGRDRFVAVTKGTVTVYQRRREE